MIKYKHDHQYNHIIYCNDDSKKTICEHSMILSNRYHIDHIVAMSSHHVFPVFLPAQASAIRRSGGAAALSTEGEAAGVAAILVVLAVLVATVGTHGRHLGIGRCR